MSRVAVDASRPSLVTSAEPDKEALCLLIDTKRMTKRGHVLREHIDDACSGAPIPATSPEMEQRRQCIAKELLGIPIGSNALGLYIRLMNEYDRNPGAFDIELRRLVVLKIATSFVVDEG